MLAQDLSLRLLETMQQVLQTSALMTAQPNKLCKALQFLEMLPDGTGREELVLMAHSLVKRNK